MKLTIIRLFEPDAQDCIDLAKIWPGFAPNSWVLDDSHRIYAAKFNDRLLGAVRVTLGDQQQGKLDALQVREVTRRRGVGRYLIEEVLRGIPSVAHWQMTDAAIEDHSIMDAFMHAVGFKARPGGWEK